MMLLNELKLIDIDFGEWYFYIEINNVDDFTAKIIVSFAVSFQFQHHLING